MEGRIETPQIVRIAGHDRGSESTSEQDYACVHHIFVTFLPANYTHGLSLRAIELAHGHDVRSKQTGQTRLFAAVLQT